MYNKSFMNNIKGCNVQQKFHEQDQGRHVVSILKMADGGCAIMQQIKNKSFNLVNMKVNYERTS